MITLEIPFAILVDEIAELEMMNEDVAVQGALLALRWMAYGEIKPSHLLSECHGAD